MKKEFVVIGFFIIGIIFLPVVSLCDAACPPSVEYDLTNEYNASLDLSNNGQNQETIKNWWIEENTYCEGCEPKEDMRSRSIHGVVYPVENFIIKNNGYTNLTNVTVIGYHEIVKIIPVLAPNETFSVRIECYLDTEIFTEQGVYANFYTVECDSGSCWNFELNFFSLISIILAILLIVFGIFCSIKYKKTKKKQYLTIIVITILLAVIFLILAFLSGWVCYIS